MDTRTQFIFLLSEKGRLLLYCVRFNMSIA